MAPCWLVGSVFAILPYYTSSLAQFAASQQYSAPLHVPSLQLPQPYTQSAVPPKNGVTTRYVAPLPGVHTQFLVIAPHYRLSMYSKASNYVVLGSWKKPCISKTVHHEVGKNPKIRVSQMFLESIQNRVSARSGHLEAAYLEALLQYLYCTAAAGWPTSGLTGSNF